jgi:hypothetical protein
MNVLTLPLTLTENAGFSPAFIYGRRSLPSKNDLDFKAFMGLAPHLSMEGEAFRLKMI